MGTNYYAIKSVCKCCGRRDIEHIGKSSIGWQFLFQSTNEIKDFSAWLENIKSAECIQDEYGRPVSIDEILKMIDAKHSLKSHVEDAMKENYREYVFSDLNGHEFWIGDFS